MAKFLLVTGDFVYPTNHGGRVDVWNRILTIHKMGEYIHLICTVKKYPKQEYINIVNNKVDKLTIIQRKNNLFDMICKRPLQMTSRKKLKEIENINSMKKLINEKGKLSKIKLKKGQNESKYEEIIIPKEEDDKEISNEEMRKTFTQAIYDFQKTHSKFDYQKNNNELNESIDNNNISANTSSNIKMSTEGTNSKNETNNFEEPNEIGEYIENKDKTSNVKELLPLNSKKILCYQCWNVILRKDCLSKYEKPFCSEKCFKIYESINYTNCRTCSKRIKIVDCLPSFNNRNVYYCSLGCLEQLEPERKNWIKKNLIDDDERSESSSRSNVSEKQIDILDL